MCWLSRDHVLLAHLGAAPCRRLSPLLHSGKVGYQGSCVERSSTVKLGLDLPDLDAKVLHPLAAASQCLLAGDLENRAVSLPFSVSVSRPRFCRNRSGDKDFT